MAKENQASALVSALLLLAAVVVAEGAEGAFLDCSSMMKVRHRQRRQHHHQDPRSWCRRRRRLQDTAPFHPQRQHLHRLGSSSSHEDSGFDLEKVQEMEELVLSLSRETSDKLRRTRLQQIFEEKIHKELDEESSANFARLFDQVLIVVGDRVRTEAAQQLQAENDTSTSTTMGNKQDDEDELPSFPLSSQKSDTQLQLWALVDMMVQSKTIVKRASGQLGSEGEFG